MLFILYVNDIQSAVSGNKLKLFADDTNLFLYNSDLSKLILEANSDLQSLQRWFIANKLSLNIGKTYYSIFTPHRSPVSLPVKIEIEGHELKREKCCKYLGVMLDLSWSSHINYLNKKLLKSVGLFYKIRNNLT